ncbi:adenosylcobinamide-phosphate synthase CbiB [Endothiovibrio diazotrophicus]
MLLSSPLVVVAALLLDRLLGEARSFHPLVGFGRYAGWLERRLNRDGRWGGVAAVGVAVTPWVLLAALPPAGWPSLVAGMATLYLAVGARSLAEHGRAVAEALDAGSLEEARRRVGWMVSRDVSRADEEAVARAAVESVLENGNDALFGALFWFLLAGAPGVVAYRLVNTLDAMWGYRNRRFARFGWAAARLDDLMNYLPARLTAVGYGLAGGAGAWRCWSRQAGAWEGVNPGVVMAAGAGALGVRLGGGARYHGVWRERPTLGEGEVPRAADVRRAVALVGRAAWLWVVVTSAVAASIAFLGGSFPAVG